MTHPWDKLPRESAKAYRAFTCYLELGPKRSLVAAAEAYAGPKKRQKSARKAPRKSAPGHITRWANQHDWTTRAEAFDQHQLEQRISARAEVRERAREKLFEMSGGLVERLVELTGIDPADAEVQPALYSVKLKAIIAALDRIGVTPIKDPEKLEITHDVADDHDSPAAELARRIARIAERRGADGGTE